jgi:hypothetical protein
MGDKLDTDGFKSRDLVQYIYTVYYCNYAYYTTLESLKIPIKVAFNPNPHCLWS